MPIAAENAELALNVEVWSLVVAIATFALGAVISVVLYKLGRKLDFRSRMHRWDELRATTGALLAEVRGGQTGNEVVLINARRYERDYDGGNSVNRHGDLQARATTVSSSGVASRPAGSTNEGGAHSKRPTPLRRTF